MCLLHATPHNLLRKLFQSLLKGKLDKIDWRVLMVRQIGLFVDFSGMFMLCVVHRIKKARS